MIYAMLEILLIVALTLCILIAQADQDSKMNDKG